MANLKDIRGRIASVKNIRKITRAMEMVAAARLRRAEQRIDAMRPYAQAIRKLTREVAETDEQMAKRVPLMETRDVSTVGVLLVTGDRGLAGAFNTQIIREGVRLKREYKREESAETVYRVVGRRGSSTMSFHRNHGPMMSGGCGLTSQLSMTNPTGSLPRYTARYHGLPSGVSAGQCATSGVLIPPSWTKCLYSRNGVLDTFAQFWPYAMNVSSAPGITFGPLRTGRPSRVTIGRLIHCGSFDWCGCGLASRFGRPALRPLSSSHPPLSWRNRISVLSSSPSSSRVRRMRPFGIHRKYCELSESFVVYDAPEAEISALVMDDAGNVYAGTAEARDEPQPPPPPRPPPRTA